VRKVQKEFIVSEWDNIQRIIVSLLSASVSRGFSGTYQPVYLFTAARASVSKWSRLHLHNVLVGFRKLKSPR
jgi:hypothetical protein